MAFEIDSSVRVARTPDDIRDYRATMSGFADNHIGLVGKVIREDRTPEGKTAVEFFQGDLGYEPDGTREDPDPDDMIRVFVQTDCLEAA